MSYLIIVVAAFVQCTLSAELPQPVLPDQCGIPDCSILANRYHENAVFAHQDPNRYYQCVPYSLWEWKPMERWCICGTVFNPKVSRCSYWWDEEWETTCDEHTYPPELAKCERHYDGWVTPPADSSEISESDEVSHESSQESNQEESNQEESNEENQSQSNEQE